MKVFILQKHPARHALSNGFFIVTQNGAEIGKVVTIIIGAFALVLGIQEPRVIYHFVLASWSGLGSAFGPAVIGILYYRRVTWLGVLAGVLGGFVASVAWLMFFKEDWHGLYEAIPGFIAGMVLTFGVSRLTYRSGE